MGEGVTETERGEGGEVETGIRQLVVSETGGGERRTFWRHGWGGERGELVGDRRV